MCVALPRGLLPLLFALLAVSVCAGAV